MTTNKEKEVALHSIASTQYGARIQLPLKMSPRLPYTSEGFLLHNGVRNIVELIDQSFHEGEFRIFFVSGKARRGKTHLSIYLFDSAARAGFYPRLVDGQELSVKIEDINAGNKIVIIDDAHEYLVNVAAGNSGAFVKMVETLRVAKAKLILLSSVEVEELTCDDHVKSRLRPGQGLSIESPTDFSLSPLIQLMAKQRGLKLTDRKVNFLLRRLGQDIRSIEDYLDRVNYLSTLFGREVKFPLLSDAL